MLPDGAAATVLIVDDDVEALDALASILEFEGCRVATAVNGKAALDYLRQNAPPDLVISDLVMPEMNGWQLRAELKRDPVLARVPILIVTALNTRGLDVDAMLLKPLDVDQLLVTMGRLLHHPVGYSGTVLIKIS
ncbi:MAG: response regulator [Candidatus Binataceae bacterium]